MAYLKTNGTTGNYELVWSKLEIGLAATMLTGLLAVIGGGLLAWRDLGIVQTEVNALGNQLSDQKDFNLEIHRDHNERIRTLERDK